MRVTIVAPGCQATQSVEIDAGERIVVGRDPGVPDGKTRTLTVDHPSVSASHLAIDATADTVVLRDLQSTNGSLVELVHGGRLEAPRDATLRVHLAGETRDTRAHDFPDDVEYASSKDFGRAIATSIERWSHARHVPIRVREVARRDDDGVLAVGHVPLACGTAIELDVDSTVPRGWLDALAIVERYVARQNRLFANIEELRAEGMIVASDAMRDALRRVVDAAAGGARTLLILGPSGAGKEGLARCFHRRTGRPGSFVARNCALFHRDLARSELFGAQKGAFTGCAQRIIGAVEAANHGTLFLDELGELPLDIQPMLLRFLDRGEYECMGRYTKASVSDAVVVGTTNRDLRTLAIRNEFRLDLWFRLSGDVVEVPPLSRRFADVEAYLHSRTVVSGESIADLLSPGAMSLLAGHSWDGNFRELIQFADRIVRAQRRGVIDADTCRAALSAGALGPVEAAPSRARATPIPDAPLAFDRSYQRAQSAYRDDHDARMPASWDEVKEFVENYFKPAVFASLAGADTLARVADADLRAAAKRVGADRGTASKQLARYVDRFAAMQDEDVGS